MMKPILTIVAAVASFLGSATAQAQQSRPDNPVIVCEADHAPFSATGCDLPEHCSLDHGNAWASAREGRHPHPNAHGQLTRSRSTIGAATGCDLTRPWNRNVSVH